MWKNAYTGRPDPAPDPTHDDTRIFSSPSVADGKVLFGVSADGARGRRGYIAAANLDTGAPVWTLETDVDTNGTIQNDGCGNVWSSATLLPNLGFVVFDTADCHFNNPPPLSETVVALRVRDGSIAWSHQPPRHDALCDLEFGATPNADVDGFGHASFLRLAGKDGTYYSLDPATGQPIWNTNVVFGGFSGGFIGTTAYDGTHIFGVRNRRLPNRIPRRRDRIHTERPPSPLLDPRPRDAAHTSLGAAATMIRLLRSGALRPTVPSSPRRCRPWSWPAREVTLERAARLAVAGCAVGTAGVARLSVDG